MTWPLRLLRMLRPNQLQSRPIGQRTCIAPERQRTSQSSEWRIERYGPFTSSGGNDWHRFRITDVGGLEPLLSKHHRDIVHVDAFFVSPASANGTVLALPPYHIHHANLSP